LKKTLPNEFKIYLLQVARGSIKEYLGCKKISSSDKCFYNEINFKAGCFVTIYKTGTLRGCVGTFDNNNNIIDNVSIMAKQSAFNDPRFPILKESELDIIDIEISIIAPMVLIVDLDSVEIGRDGLYVEKGSHSGVLLPQVASERNWSKEEFLSYTCLKASLDYDAWRKEAWDKDEFKVYRFEAVIFSEKELFEKIPKI